MSEAELLRELDEKLRGISVEGLWSPASDADMATYSKDPHTSVLPHVWRWPELYSAIQTVANMHGLDGKAERRVLRLINPAYLDQKNRRQRTTVTSQIICLKVANYLTWGRFSVLWVLVSKLCLIVALLGGELRAVLVRLERWFTALFLRPVLGLV